MNEFDPKTHTYYIDGKPATGVTSIIGVLAKPNLYSWYARVAAEHIDGFIREVAEHIDLPSSIEDGTWSRIVEEAKKAGNKKKEAAGTHGTDAHALVEKYITLMINDEAGVPFEMNDDPTHYWKPIQPFIKWSVENVDHFLFAERRMFNKELFIAGTADFAYIGKDGKKYMADFKTSSGIYGIDYWLQVAAYRMLAEAEGDTPYDGATVVRLGKDGQFEVQILYEYERMKEAFLACLTIYRAQGLLPRIHANAK